MDVRFIKLSPTENITLLVPDEVPRELQGGIASRLMRWDGVAAEQVGYIEKPTMPGARARLQMMGGEFCGNAAMSLGAVLAREDGLPEGEEREYVLEVSGSDSLVACRIARVGNGYRGSVAMPPPVSIAPVELELDGRRFAPAAVVFPGITHLLIPADCGLSETQAEEALPEWCAHLGAEALGLLFIDEDRDSMKPLVYVPGSGSICWERGCGSGAAALGCCRAYEKKGPCRVRVSQPGGVIEAEADGTGGIIGDVRISGLVRLLAEGVAYL